MASIKDSTNQDLSGFSPVTPSPTPAAPPVTNSQPGPNPFLRCPLPVLYENNPDALRQFQVGGSVPANRLLTPLAPVANVGNITETNYFDGGSGGSGGGGSDSNFGANRGV